MKRKTLQDFWAHSNKERKTGEFVTHNFTASQLAIFGNENDFFLFFWCFLFLIFSKWVRGG